MSRLLFVVFLFFGEVRESYFAEVILYPSKEKVCHFPKIHNHIRKLEGNYVWHKSDLGGETYGGISRRINPSWYGWRYIDQAKPLKRHDKVEQAEVWVLDYYLDIWVKEGFENIDDYYLALNLFDFRIHSSPRTVSKLTSNVLKQMGCESVKVGGDWVDSRFNQVDPLEFTLRLKIQRLILFNQIVARSPKQRVFLEGWLNRIENI